jgi:phage-related protein
MAAPGLLGALTNPTVQKGVQNAGNAVKGALTSLPGPVGGAYKNVFNTQTSISNSMSSNMGRLAQGARQLMTPSAPLGGMSSAARGFTK